MAGSPLSGWSGRPAVVVCGRRGPGAARSGGWISVKSISNCCLGSVCHQVRRRETGPHHSLKDRASSWPFGGCVGADWNHELLQEACRIGRGIRRLPMRAGPAGFGPVPRPYDGSHRSPAGDRRAVEPVGRLAETIRTAAEAGRGPIEKARLDMPTFTLTDVSHEVWVENLTVDAAQLGLAVTAPWSVSKRRLRGGRRDGVDLIVVDNGALRFAVVPTRGMGLWKGFYLGNFLGWESPITDGPVHPGVREPGGGRRPGLARRLRRADGPLRAGEQRGAVRGQDGPSRRLGEPYDLRPARPDRQHPRLVRGRARRPRAAPRDRRRGARRRVAALRPAVPPGDPVRDGPRLEPC